MNYDAKNRVNNEEQFGFINMNTLIKLFYLSAQRVKIH